MKIEQVKKTVKEMYKNNQRLTIREIINQSGVCQRVVVKVVKDCPEYDRNKYKC